MARRNMLLRPYMTRELLKEDRWIIFNQLVEVLFDVLSRIHKQHTPSVDFVYKYNFNVSEHK